MREIALFVLAVLLAGCVSSPGGGGPAPSEGSRDEPVPIGAASPHAGSVTAGGTSYYVFQATERADLTIEVQGDVSHLELVSYGYDGSYNDRQSSSQGDALDVQEYFLERGLAVYFAVHELSGKAGSRYSIVAREEPYLDPIGIELRGYIYQEARELASGQEHEARIGVAGLDYYRVVVTEGPVLAVSAAGLPEHARLIFFGTDNGDYESAETSTEKGTTRLRITGLSPATICLFYVVVPEALARAGDRFIVVVTESSGE